MGDEPQRRPDEIEDEIASLKAAAKEKGKKVDGYRIGKLTRELIASLKSLVEAKTESLADSSHGVCTDADLPLVGCAIQGSNMPYNTGTVSMWSAATPETDEHQSDEWRFIERACAEVVSKGVVGGAAKGHYLNIKAKVKAWRMTRRILDQVGVGGTWPEFPQLGIRHDTGKPLHDHSVWSDDWIPDFKPEPVAAKGVEDGVLPHTTAAPPHPVAPDATPELAAAKAMAEASIGADLMTRPDLTSRE